MKNILLIISLLFLFAGCSHTYIGNTSFEKLKTATAKDYAVIGLGMCASILTHELAHIAFLEAYNADYSIKFKSGEVRIFYDDLGSDSKIRWVSRAGLLSQNIVGLFLPKDSYFAIGYNSMSAVQTMSYPLRRSDYGDLYELDKHGGNKTLEWGLYSILSGYNLFRIEW